MGVLRNHLVKIITESDRDESRVVTNVAKEALLSLRRWFMLEGLSLTTCDHETQTT